MATVLDQDIRLDDRQIAMMEQMLEMNPDMDPAEAKKRVMCIAVLPDHHKPMPPKGGLYPRTVYHPDGRIRNAVSEQDHEAAKAAGWLDTPQEIHVERAQEPNKKQLEALEAELQAQLRKVRAQMQETTPTPDFEVNASVAQAVEKKRAAAKK